MKGATKQIKNKKLGSKNINTKQEHQPTSMK
jgi:hypothetical protein